MTEQLEDKACNEVESDEEHGENKQEEATVPVKNPSGCEWDVFAINNDGYDEEDDGNKSSAKRDVGLQSSLLRPVLHHKNQLDEEEEAKEA